jgi:hypothetical protein
MAIGHVGLLGTAILCDIYTPVFKICWKWKRLDLKSHADLYKIFNIL